MPGTTPFSDAELVRRRRTSFTGFLELIASGHPDSTVTRIGDGVMACRTPASPRRSIFNSVAFSGPEDELVGVLPKLQKHYESAGVRAWTVWLHDPELNSAARDALSAAGHKLDASPVEMGAAIDEVKLDVAALPDEVVFDECRWEEVAAVNEIAYGVEPGQFAAALGGVPKNDRHHVLAARDEHGAAVSVGVFVAHESNAEVAWIATLPDWRGRGLAGAVMTRGLSEAREAGSQTATLEATKAGQPVYSALGFRSFGPVEMWERRW